jgi:hypothetical protein
MNDIGGAINLLDGAQEAAGKNRIINGAIDIWQRGTSFAGTTLGAYCADRWGYYRGGAAGGATWSRQAAALTGFQYGLRAQRDNANTSTQYVGTWQTIESINSIPLAGQTVTLSFYAKCGANYSATANALAVTVITGTGTDQAVYSFTGSTNAITGTATLTTSYQRFTYTGALSASLTEVGVQFIGTPTGTAGANDWYEITGVQLEIASTASNFQTATGNIGSELAACQRYLPAVYANTETFGFAYSATGTQFYGSFQVTPRIAPTGITISSLSDFTVYNQGFTAGTPTAITRNTASTSTYSYTVTTTAGSPTLVTGQPSKMQITGANGYALFTGCEL